ncbi:hypothetical protein ACTNDY_11370 [Tissierellaceae bacterium HCP3S3_D8]
MKKKIKKVNKLAYLGLIGFLSIPLALYTKDPKWFGLCGFFGFLGYFNAKQGQSSE